MSYFISGKAKDPTPPPNPQVLYAPATNAASSSVDYGKFQVNGRPITVQPHPKPNYAWR